MNANIELGRSAGFEALQNRKPLAPLLIAALQIRSTQPGADFLGGLFEVLCLALDACQASRTSFDWKDGARAKVIAEALPQERRFLLFAGCQSIDQAAADVLSDLAGAIYAVRETLVVQPRAAEKVEQPVTQVQIVGMPGRTTEANISRVNGQIVGSVTTETDA